MTYILGWKLGPAVYLVGDTALTTHGAGDDAPSSFGERPFRKANRVTCEGALKVIRLGTSAVAYSGDVATGRSLVRAFRTAVLSGIDPKDAIQRAAISLRPFSPQTTVTFLAAIPACPVPRLLSFNARGDRRLVEHNDGELVQLGSVTPQYRGLTGQMIRRLKLFAGEPARFLVATLAFLQSLGLRNYLPRHRIGGAFCGLHAQSGSVDWQKDVLFCLHKGLEPDLQMVSALVRDSVLVVRSTLSDSCRYFADQLACGPFEAWKAKWWDSSFDLPTEGRFDYVVLLNLKWWVITVIEMLCHHSSRHLRIKPAPGQNLAEAFRLNLAFSPLVAEVMNQPVPNRHDGSRPFRFNWFPYETPE